MYKKSIKNFLIVIIITLVIFNPITLNFYIDKLDSLINSDGFDMLYSDDASITSDGDLVSDKDLDKLKDSDITGENYNFDTLYYPYFGYLNENQQKIYKQIYANAVEYVTTFVPTENISVEEVKEVFEALYNDHPELFWVNTSYSYKYTSNDICVQIILNFNETADNIDYYKKLFDDAANKIIKEANKYNTDYLKEKYVHDTIVKSVKYDKNASMNQSAYSALVNKKTICAGYSRAFQYIMIQLHIPTYYCVGISKVNHAWNIVKLDDGYYNVDLTWDTSDITRYKYFNKTDSDFSKSHKRTGLSLNLPKCNAYKYRNINTTTVTSNTSSINTVSNKTSNKVSNITSNVTSNTTSNIVIIHDNEVDTDSDSKQEKIEEIVPEETVEDEINDEEVEEVVEESNNNEVSNERGIYERRRN